MDQDKSEKNNGDLAFLSYSHADREFAKRVAEELTKSGIEVWWDEWEIKPGDSLIDKIFRQGLSRCSFFLVILSCFSVESKWVKEELDSAWIKRIEGSVRVIPLIKEKCNIPLPLRALKWVDLSEAFDEGIHEIVKTIHNVSEKPPLGETPNYIKGLSDSIGGLSRLASTIGLSLVRVQDDQLNYQKVYTPEEIQKMFPSQTPDEINDAIQELEDFGLIRVTRWMGTAPYHFGEVEPTYALFLQFRERLDYDPFDDIKIIASAVNSEKQLSGKEIQKISGLRVLRINRAVEYLKDYGIVKVRKELGTAPFDFTQVIKTYRTHKFVEENCK